MRKAFTIVMCVLAICFASCNKEKPNQQFIGTYKGEVTTIASASAMGITTMDTIEINLTMQISAGTANTQVVAICTIEDESRTINGTVSRNVVDFDPFTYYLNIEGAQATLTINMDGTLNGNVLNVSGPISGNGTINFPGTLTPVAFTLSGNLSGALDRALQN